MSTVAELAAVLLAAIFVFVQGFMSGAETGAYVVNRLRLRLRVQAGLPAALRLRRLLDDPRGLITTTLIGQSLAVFAVSTLIARALEAHVAHLAVVSTLIVTPALFIFGEVAPKNLFRRYADVLMYSAGRWLLVARRALAPLVFVMNALSGPWRPAVRRPGVPPDPLRSRDRVVSLIALGAEEGLLTPYQRDMASNILRVASVAARDVMIPLDQVVTVREPIDHERVLAALAAGSHARYPIVRADGAIISFVDATASLLDRRAGEAAAPAVHPLLRLPADTTVPGALDILQDARHPIGLVVDELDRPLGLVTIKDLVEEIVGELSE